MNLQEILSLTIIVLLVIVLCIALLAYWRMTSHDRALRKLADAPGPERMGREILPLSSTGGNRELSVYDAEKNAWRKVGVVNANGTDAIADDPGGDGARLVKGKLYRLVARPQRVAFRPERIVIKNGNDWNVHDIKIGNRSQFSQSGIIPGACFDADAIDTFVSFETLQTAMDFTLEFSYHGEKDSAPFVGSVIGTAAI